MALTVTGTATNNTFGGGQLVVQVLDNAALAGTPAIASSTTAFNTSITTTQAGSFVFGAVNNQTASTTFVASSGCTIISQASVNAGGAQGGAFKTSAGTGTPGATTVGSSTTFPGNYGVVALEVLASGGSLSVDGSSPAAVSSTTATSFTSASFNPPGGSILVATLVASGNGTAATCVGSVSGGGLIWTEQVKISTTVGGTNSYSGIWTAVAPAALPPAPLLVQPGKTWQRRFKHRQQALTPPFMPPPMGVVNLQAAGSLSTAVTQAAGATLAGAGSLSAVAIPYITGLSGSTSADYFTDQSGKPRWMFCDSIWTIVYSAGRSGAQTWQQDIDQVVSTRASQGYTAIQTNLLPNNEYIASGLTTWDGIHPFVTGVDPTSGLNSSYWARADYLVAAMAAKGMTWFANLLMGEDLASGVAGSWTSTQKTAFGNAVASRYASTPNIVWMINDDGGVDATTMTNILTGVRATGDSRFIAVENPQETTSRFGLKLNDVQTWGSSNAQYNWVYTYAPSYGGVEYAFAESSAIPVIRGDGYYYNSDGNPSDKISRESFWWCISSGSRGYSWGMSDGGWGAFATGWASNLTMTADEAGTAGDFQNNVFPAVTTYLTTLPNWQKLAPDTANTFITAGRGTRAPYQTEGIQNQYTGTPADTYVSGSYAADGSIAMIYFSRGVTTTITIDQTKLASGYTGKWVDPATCATTTATTGSTYTKPTSANSAGDHDWLLLLQAPVVTTISGTATLTGTASLTAAATQGAGATLGAAGSLAAPATERAGATLGAAASLGDVAVQGSGGTLGGAGSLATAATQAAIATLGAAGSLTSLATLSAPASLNGTASLAAPGTQAAPATLGGTATLTGSSGGGASGGGTLGGAGSIGVLATLAAPATLGAAGSLASLGTTAAPATLAGAASLAGLAVQAAPATLGGTASLAALVTLRAPASLNGTATLTAIAGNAQSGIATLGAAASLAAPGTTAAAVVLAGTASLSDLAVIAAIAQLAARGALAGATAQQGAALLTAAAILAATGTQRGPFTVGTLTAADKPGAALAAADSPRAGGSLTASDQRTGGPG